MKFTQQALPFLLLLSLCGCSKFSNSKLAGNWQAVEVIQDNPLQVDLSQVNFAFHESGNYQYNGTLGYKEAGFFEISDNKLLTVDTLNEGSSQKFVEILKLTNDSLLLKMLENGNPQLLKLVKK